MSVQHQTEGIGELLSCLTRRGWKVLSAPRVPAPPPCLTVARGHYTPAASPSSPTQVKGSLLIISRFTPANNWTDSPHSPGHQVTGLTPKERHGPGKGHHNIKSSNPRLTWGGPKVRWAPPYPKAAGKEGDRCLDGGHRAAGTGKGSESTKEKAS